MVPGPGYVARVVVTKFINSWQNAPAWQTALEVPAGGTASVAIGGIGRPVSGTVVLDRQPDVALDWTTNEPATLTLEEEKPADRGWFRCAANIDRDGHFQIPDVPAGHYKLTIPINGAPKANACGAGSAIGRATLDVVVPPMADGRSDEPLDLGTITATMFDTLDPGEPAPIFVLKDLAGETVRLSDYHGRLVLVNFWATWSAPCIAELPSLVAIHKKFAADARFAMISLACDRQAETVRRHLEKEAMPWIQLHAGSAAGNLGATAKRYTLDELPGVFLIGPDGRVLAKNLKSAELETAIAAALADDAPFVAARAAGPPARFPVLRFEVDSTPPLARRKAGGVAASMTPIRIGIRDARMPKLATRPTPPNGSELWAVGGFNNFTRRLPRPLPPDGRSAAGSESMPPRKSATALRPSIFPAASCGKSMGSTSRSWPSIKKPAISGPPAAHRSTKARRSF